MTRTSAKFYATVPLLLLILGQNAANVNAQDQPIKRTELVRTDISDIEGREGVMYIAEVVPGGASPKHTHPGHEFLYVLEGVLVIEPEGKEPITVKQGETAQQPAGVVHLAKNGSDTEPAKVLVFLVSEKGKPLATVVK